MGATPRLPIHGWTRGRALDEDTTGIDPKPVALKELIRAKRLALLAVARRLIPMILCGMPQSLGRFPASDGEGVVA